MWFFSNYRTARDGKAEPLRQEIAPPSQAEGANLYDVGRAALPAGSAGTERYLTRFLVRPEYMG